ncbi:MAG: hypothetical protein ABI351_02510 [Herbaspirillum sp.]
MDKLPNTCETVKVVSDGEHGYKVINLSDLTDEHELYEPADEQVEQRPKRGRKPKVA